MHRRGFVQLLLAALATAGCRGTTLRPIEGPTHRVVVIGAGIAGLAAARMLTAAGIEVIVVEGRDRIGGRTYTAQLADARVDLGAAWIHGARRNPVAELCDGLGITYRLHDYDFEGGWDAIGGAPMSEAQMVAGEDALEEIAGALADLRDALGPSASLQDGIDRFVAAQGYSASEERAARFALEQLMCEVDYAGPTTRTSLATINEEEWYGPDDHLVDGGYGSLVDALARDLDVRTSTAATRVVYSDTGVEVHTIDGEVLAADRVVVTVPIGVLKAGTIAFDPPLPTAKTDALSRFDMSSLEKVVLRFDAAFWDRSGAGAWLHIGRDRGELPAIVDLTHHAGAPTLVLLHGGQRVRDVLPRRTDEQLVADALAVVELVMGTPPPVPIATAVTRWHSDPFSRGSYLYPTLGASLSDIDTLSQPVLDRVLFAGEGTSREYFGTVHGALHSGIREAQRLGGDPAGLPGVG